MEKTDLSAIPGRKPEAVITREFHNPSLDVEALIQKAYEFFVNKQYTNTSPLVIDQKIEDKGDIMVLTVVDRVPIGPISIDTTVVGEFDKIETFTKDTKFKIFAKNFGFHTFENVLEIVKTEQSGRYTARMSAYFDMKWYISPLRGVVLKQWIRSHGLGMDALVKHLSAEVIS